jgi:hypothetical protein
MTKISILALADVFIVPHYGVTNNRDLGAYTKNPNESNPEELAAVLDRVG